MADVLTIVGAKDTEVATVVQSMVSKFRRAKAEIESLSISAGGSAGGGSGGGGPFGGHPLYTGSRLAGYGNPLFASAFRDRAAIEAIEARVAAQSGGGAGGGMLSLGGMGRAAGAIGLVGGALAGLNRASEKIREIGEAQDRWSKSVETTVSKYTQLVSEVGKVFSLSEQMRNSATKDAQEKTRELMEAGIKRTEELDGGSVPRRWMRGSMINASAYLSRVPGLNDFLGYDKPTEFYGDQAERTAREAEAAANQTARDGNIAVQNAIAEGKKKELQAAQDAFVTNGKLLSQASEQAQREAEAKQKEIAAREKAKQLATEDLRVSDMINSAQVERLQGREKEARLLEANAEYLQKHLELERDANLTNEQKSERQMQAWKIYQLQNADIEKNAARGGRSVGADLSLVGGASAAMMKDSISDDMLKEARESKKLLETIAKNTAKGGVAVMG